MSQRQLNLILLSGTEPEFHEHSKILSVQSSVEVYKTWFNSNRTERRKLLIRESRSAFAIRSVSVGYSCRVRIQAVAACESVHISIDPRATCTPSP
ncbi:hypothetical protein QQG55_41225 [Brugia pahangi]